MTKRPAAAQASQAYFPRLWPWIVAGALILAGLVGWTTVPELKSLDWRFRYRGPQQPHPFIRLIAIDDSSLTQIGRWPWPRQHHADFIDALQPPAFRPRVIGYDVLFTEPQTEHLEYDAELGRASRQAGTLCHAYFFIREQDPPEVSPAIAATLSPWAIASPASALPAALTGQRVTVPIPELREGSRLGFVDSPPDADGVTRHVPLVMAYQGQLYPSLSLQLACAAWGVAPQQVRVVGGRWLDIERPREGRVRVPIDAQGRLLVNFVGDFDAFKPYPLVTFIQWINAASTGEKIPEPLAALHDRIVLIGAAAVGMGDVRVTPMAPTSYGFLVHANALDNLLSGRFLRQAPDWIVICLLLLLCVVIGEAAARLSPVRAALICLTLLTSYLALAIVLFIHAGWWLELVRPAAGGLMTFGGITIYRFNREEREKRWIRQAFGRYVSPKILEEVLRSPDKLRLGGERRELTVLFSDVRGFTTFSEKHSPEEVVEMLNALLDRLTMAILRHEGTLDKYVGDAIMAIFGAPGEMDTAAHAKHACAAALDMVQTLRQLQDEWRAKGQEVLDIGIGINTGPMVVGNMGSTQVMGYTVIGDAVNLGARVEGLTRQHQCAVVITESTYELVKDAFEAERIGEVHVKGKEQPVIVYKLLPATSAVAATT